MVRLLRRAGHEVASASTGTAALAALKDQQFDLFISDIGLPDINGWEVVQRLRREQPAVRTIALTGYGYPNDYKRSMEMGFDMHLTKPIDWRSVQEAISSLFPAAAPDALPGQDRN